MNRHNQKRVFTLERQTVEAEICVCNLLLEDNLQIVLSAALLMRGKRIAQKLGHSSGKMKVTEVVNPAPPSASKIVPNPD